MKFIIVWESGMPISWPLEFFRQCFLWKLNFTKHRSSTKKVHENLVSKEVPRQSRALSVASSPEFAWRFGIGVVCMLNNLNWMWAKRILKKKSNLWRLITTSLQRFPKLAKQFSIILLKNFFFRIHSFKRHRYLGSLTERDRGLAVCMIVLLWIVSVCSTDSVLLSPHPLSSLKFFVPFTRKWLADPLSKVDFLSCALHWKPWLLLIRCPD